MSRYETFDRSQLNLLPLNDRIHDLDISCIKDLTENKNAGNDLQKVGHELLIALEKSAPVVMMIGAHVIRSGMQRYIIDLMEKGAISCLSLNGAGVIHDYEFARIGHTTESVAKYISNGQFGLWNETGFINDIVKQGDAQGLGLGEAVGKEIEEGDYPHSDISLLAAGYRLGIPVTVHVGIGYDIIAEHPNFDGAAFGSASYRDFMIFTNIIQHLENGVFMVFGSAIMGPEVYLKALAMARNVAHQNDRAIKHFTTLVCDLADLPENYRDGPNKMAAAYYFRPWKTILCRTVEDGGMSYYVKGRHDETIPQLWTVVRNTIT